MALQNISNDGRKLHTGPAGGVYYKTASGNKVYVTQSRSKPTKPTTSIYPNNYKDRALYEGISSHLIRKIKKCNQTVYKQNKHKIMVR